MVQIRPWAPFIFLKALPLFPTISRKDNPRSYFADAEYKKLRDTAKDLASQSLKVRGVPLTQELYDFIIFATNVFVRPSDLKLLQHKHVEVVREPRAKYLLITPPKSKTVQREKREHRGCRSCLRALTRASREDGVCQRR